MTSSTTALRPSFTWGGYLTGFALGGFFDGILLHQILQWHHLLSAVDGAGFRDLRFQVLADGYFHALMYLIATIGLWLLWKGREVLAAHSQGRALLGNLLLGFGVWHIVDSVLSHWVLGIHRIRMDSSNPLLWDVIWLVAFGLIPLAIGWFLRRSDGPGPRRPNASITLPLIVAVLVTTMGAVALRPPPDSSFTTVLFRPGTSMNQVFEAMHALDGRLVWMDRTGELVVFHLPETQSTWRLYGRGALLVSSSGMPGGCFSWSRV